MAPHGLKNSDPVHISLIVGNNLQKRQKALSQTPIGKNISHEAKTLTKILAEAIKQGDANQLFELERIAIKRDRECFGAYERRTAAMASIIDAAHRFAETATPEGAKKFLEAVGGGKLPSQIPPSDMVRNTVKNLKSQINELIDSTSIPALKLYYSRRKDALDFIKKEHVKNLEAGLGHDKQRQCEKNCGLSR